MTIPGPATSLEQSSEPIDSPMPRRRSAWRWGLALLLLTAGAWVLLSRSVDRRLVGPWQGPSLTGSELLEYELRRDGTCTTFDPQTGSMNGGAKHPYRWSVEQNVLVLRHREPLWPDEGSLWKRSREFVINAMSRRSAGDNHIFDYRYQLLEVNADKLELKILRAGTQKSFKRQITLQRVAR